MIEIITPYVSVLPMSLALVIAVLGIITACGMLVRGTSKSPTSLWTLEKIGNLMGNPAAWLMVCMVAAVTMGFKLTPLVVKVDNVWIQILIGTPATLVIWIGLTYIAVAISGWFILRGIERTHGPLVRQKVWNAFARAKPGQLIDLGFLESTEASNKE